MERVVGVGAEDAGVEGSARSASARYGDAPGHCGPGFGLRCPLLLRVGPPSGRAGPRCRRRRMVADAASYPLPLGASAGRPAAVAPAGRHYGGRLPLAVEWRLK